MGTLLMLGGAILIQAGALCTILYSRVVSGTKFDPILYMEYQASKSADPDPLNLNHARAQRLRGSQIHDEVTMATIRAGNEMEVFRARENERELLRKEAERRAEEQISLAELYWKHRSEDVAIRQLQSALKTAPDYLPAILRLADYSESINDWKQARFFLEKAASIVPPGSPELQRIQARLNQLDPTVNLPLKIPSHRAEIARSSSPSPQGTKGESLSQQNRRSPAAATTATPSTNSKAASWFKEIRKTEMPLEDQYDLRFNLQVLIGSALAMEEMQRTKVEVSFYDQSSSAAGTIIPIKVVNSLLQPVESTRLPNEYVLSINYSVPKGYFQKQMLAYGKTYQFCGYTLRLLRDGRELDSRTEPESILQRYVTPDTRPPLQPGN
jgi:hypothetical protein